jgi:hypothetical protein
MVNPLNLHVLLYKCDFPEENADHVLYFITNIFLKRFWKKYISIYIQNKKKNMKMLFIYHINIPLVLKYIT